MRTRFGVSDPSGSCRFNTTLGVIATNANLSKKDAHHVARLAHSGLSKVISPFHTTFDGDLLFVLSLGRKRADINTVGLLGETALMESALRAITQADGFGILPAYKDVKV
jgi:L-aminopeptidase/D-esterase-like protein